MKFAQSQELADFLRKEQIFPQILSVKEICVGGSSYNFCIKTTKGEFFLKLISAKRVEIYKLLKKILSQFEFYIRCGKKGLQIFICWRCRM